MTLARTLTVSVPGSLLRLEARHFSLPVSPSMGSGTGVAPLAVIAPPHPMYGGTLGNPVLRVMERTLGQHGLSTLAFNFRGTGESEGEQTGSYDDALADYLAVTRALPNMELGWLSGYSFGSVAALASAVELDAPRVLMVAPPLGMLDPALVTRYRGQIAIVVGSEDDYAPLADLRALFEPRAQTTLEILPGVEHFFSGSDAQRLAEGLARLLVNADLHASDRAARER
jgi:alpha/beta superfamily hydrolase